MDGSGGPNAPSPQDRGLEDRGPRILLTFDNGPEPEVTPRVLDILERRGVKAAFFMLGRKLQRAEGRRLAEQAFAAGHRIGNHTFSHETPFGRMANPLDAIAEIDRTQALMGDLAGEEKLFRPFGGAGVLGPALLNRPAVKHLQANAFTLALWTSVPRDWIEPEAWPPRALADYVADQAAGRDTVLVLHDLPTGAADGLDAFLGELQARGAQFTQSPPDRATPIRRGVLTGDLTGLVAHA